MFLIFCKVSYMTQHLPCVAAVCLIVVMLRQEELIAHLVHEVKRYILHCTWKNGSKSLSLSATLYKYCKTIDEKVTPNGILSTPTNKPRIRQKRHVKTFFHNNDSFNSLQAFRRLCFLLDSYSIYRIVSIE